MEEKKGKIVGIRLTSELKGASVKFVNENHTTLSELIKAFIYESIKNDRLPFDSRKIIEGRALEKNGNDVQRIHVRIRDREDFVKFKELCERASVSYTRAIKIYLDLCMKENRIICERELNNED